MSFNINNNPNWNIPNMRISDGEAKSQEVREEKKEESINLQEAIKKFTENDSNLSDMLRVLEALHATDIETNIESERLTLSFKLNGKNYMIQSLSQEGK